MVKGYDLTISHMRNYPFFKKGSEGALKKVRRKRASASSIIDEPAASSRTSRPIDTKIGHKHSQFDAIAFPSYPRHARLERDPAIWLTKEVFDKLNRSNVFSECRCRIAVSDDQRGPGVKRNGTPDDNSWLRACVASNSERRISTLCWASPDTLDDCQDTVGSWIRR
ncbi:hypothetical protein TNCV_2062331 [Trichonephila clavipes]|nr:hypothetical protein TNCV_2062331 [Trichonephila clavipes]